MREQSPLASGLQKVEDSVQDFTETVGPRPAMSLGGGQVRLDVFPFGVGQIRWVRLSHAC